MSNFIGSFIQYVVEMVCLVAIGLCGGWVGIQLRKRKEANKEQEAASHE